MNHLQNGSNPCALNLMHLMLSLQLRRGGLKGHRSFKIWCALQYQATDIKAPCTPPNLNITTHHFHT